MSTYRLIFAGALLAGGLAAVPEPGFTVLFDGADLRHWQPGYTNWTVENGVIALKDRGDGKEHNDNYLWTREQYGDFVLELEYKAPPDKANSGIFIRASDTKDPVYTGIEIQVGNVPPGRPPGRTMVGGLYDLAAPVKNAHRPGEWNQYIITCEGPRITVALNGEKTAEADLDRWTETGKNPDGSPNKFKRPLRDFARSGYIGLQDHGLPVWFRNIRVRRLAGSAASEAPRELLFAPAKIDGPVHDPARHTYWFGPFAECASVLDINGDGKPDIAAGRNYYLAPGWTKYADYRDGAETNGPDVDDNYEGTMDVNNDGRPDVLSSGWMRRQGIWWYENPGKVGVKWNSHAIHQAEGLEGMVIGNLSGKSGKDLLVNYFARRPGRGLIWFEHVDQAPWFREHILGPENVGVSHGNGIGDINGDGRNDVVTTSGWFEAPPRPTEQSWIWHPDYQFTPYGSDRPGGAGLPILVTDANGDGLNDIIIGSDHGYGLAWYEQRLEAGKRNFTRHWIETDYPTFHTMALADLDGDGKDELITGKQLLAHNGGDVGGYEPVFVFYYKIDKGRFERHIITYSHLTPHFGPGSEKTPPPDYVVGVGMRMQVEDMDGDGRRDVVIPCRSGLYVFFNKGYTPRARGTNWMPPRESYPSHRAWESKR